MVLAAAGVCVTLVAAPIDNLWHATFGRDAVIWSPPHVLGILGLLSLSLAVLVLVSQRSGAWLAPTKALLGGAALTAVNFLVVEYETDVPQFNERYYLPVLALVSVVTFSLLRSANPGRWTATVAAGVQFLLVGVAALFLLGVGWDAPLMPLLLGPAVVFDLGDGRRWPSPLRALAHAAVFYALYVPWLNWAYHGVFLSASAVLTGLPLAVLATAIALWALDRPARCMLRRAGTATAALLAVLLLGVSKPSDALAHDPGQGKEVGRMDQVARVAGSHVELQGRIVVGDCRALRAFDLEARRADRRRHGPLHQSRCMYHGAITLPGRGRWFVYFDLRRRRAPVESWLPIKLEDSQRRFAERRRSVYLPNQSPNGPAKTAATVALYAAIVAFIVVIARFVGEAPNQAANTGAR